MAKTLLVLILGVVCLGVVAGGAVVLTVLLTARKPKP